ncbi:hypothetical protein [Pyrodictium abyssi]|uniref:Uncharacterized protein n=1 Tax=Pyrodictium abyssi TaxID=54256 RepID=A0ABM8IUR8_9CREN|nr:hypothetical protein PABY_08420 [Pyrodictium abyssi]
MTYDRQEKKSKALQAQNQVHVTIARLLRHTKERVYPLLRYQFHRTDDERVGVWTVDLPDGKNITLATYATTEASRPLTWRRIVQKLKRMRKHVAKHAPPGADVFLFILRAEEGVRATLPAYRRLAEEHIKIVSPGEVVEILVEYILKRVKGFVRKAKEKRFVYFGDVADLIRVLFLVLAALAPPSVLNHASLCREVASVTQSRRVSLPC